MTPQDLRAAVAAGILTEAQAARLTTLAHDRAAQRAALPQEDEPFEFFRGFAEIFVAIGLIILFSGITSYLWSYYSRWILYQPDLPSDTLWPFALTGLATAALAWLLAGYFTLRRRMTLPSMVLATAFGLGLAAALAILAESWAPNDLWLGFTAFLLTTVAMVLWYRRFRLPFSAFLTGLLALATLYSATAATVQVEAHVWVRGFSAFFDLGANPAYAIVTLLFGLGAFAVGMWFDTRDPHRLGRHSATAFWCHLCAAPALVNTVALSLMNTGGNTGIVLLALALFVITVLALIIDRRSFLTAGIVYIAIIITWLAGDNTDLATRALILLILGILITAIGTWWVQLRAALMRALPDFPGKSRLPPYEATK